MRFFTMAKTVLKSLFTKPFTVKYPFGPKILSKSARGSIVIDISKCIFCGMCQRKCPTAAIIVAKEAKSWEIARLRCITCGYCAEVCPKKCLSMNNQYTDPMLTVSEEVHKNA
jgi:formate hydrogenlyase subunit 6/NADH:ubiquinone oxidoreductase subunit I